MSELVVDVRTRVGAFSLDVRFTARPGVLVLFGPTASGKTLTLRLVAGIEHAREGSIRRGDLLLDDASNAFVAPHLRSVGYAPQDAALWPHRTAREHLAAFTSVAHTDELLTLVGLGLTTHAQRKPAGLSGGERQRLAFARALSRSPTLLLLDEPFSALDDVARASMGAIVRERANAGAIVLFVTHDREEATRLGDAFVVFAEGHGAPASSLD